MFPQSQQASASFGRVNLNSNMPLIGPILSAVPANLRSAAFSNWFEGFNMSWELDLWGRIRRNIESNNAALDASVESYDAALVTLLADAATNYVQYRVAEQRIKIAKDNVRIQEGTLRSPRRDSVSARRTGWTSNKRGPYSSRHVQRFPRSRSRSVRRTTRSVRCLAFHRTTWGQS